MKPKAARALLVVAVFVLLAILDGAALYISDSGRPEVHAKQRSIPAGVVFASEFRYYLAWALVTPGILWLGRRVPLRRRPWFPPLAFHVLVPVAGCLPFFCVRVLMRAAFEGPVPTWAFWRGVEWGQLFVIQSLAVAPVYWLVLAARAGVRFFQAGAANDLRAANLRRSLAAAQLDALRMKLQPHFLFNTLNAIASLAQAGDTDAVIRVVERLGTLLRLSMETSGRQFVALEEELALLDEYLAIEEIRFKDRLRVVRRIAPEAEKALVPSLILQPLVENAIVHGLARRLDACLLEIAARRDGADLYIAVRDDGPGLPAGWSMSSAAGPGLKNVLDRLSALYARTCRFQMENGATGGTVALLSVPFVEADTAIVGSAGHG